MAAGHLLAEERAPVGARYILSESTVSPPELAEAECAVAARGRVPRVMPTFVAHAVATAGELLSRVTGRPPLISRGQVHFIGLYARPSSRRIQSELGWKPTPLRDGLRRTIDWLTERGEV